MPFHLIKCRHTSYLPSGLVSRLLDLLEQPGHPELLLLHRGGHQQHLLGGGGVVGDLTGGQALPRPARVFLVQFYPAP